MNFNLGFEKKHSCHTALIRIIDDWIDGIDNGNYVGALFLDLRKTFDLVDHQILIHKLKLYNFSDNSVQLITSYLKDRHQIVKFGDSQSSRRCIRSGVPQGSILGPILFLIYINDITFEIENSWIDLYADDTTLYAKSSNTQEIERTLQINSDMVSDWCKVNNMAIHPQKTNCMLLGSNAKLRNACALNLFVDKVLIENVTSKKLLF